MTCIPFFICATCVKCREQGLSSSGYTLVMVVFGETQHEDDNSGIILVLVVLHCLGFRVLEPFLCYWKGRAKFFTQKDKMTPDVPYKLYLINHWQFQRSRTLRL